MYLGLPLLHLRLCRLVCCLCLLACLCSLFVFVGLFVFFVCPLCFYCVFVFQSCSSRVAVLEGKSTSQASLAGRLEAETATVKAENSLLRTEMGVLTQNYTAVVARIDQLEASIAARAQEDLVRAQSVDEQDKAIISVKDRSHSLKKRIKALEGQVGRGDTSDVVLSQLADFTRRLGELESAASRISGGQSTICTVARLRAQLTYVGRWVHALCEQVWDIQRYTRRRSLHVVSSVSYTHLTLPTKRIV